jgi:hypothetical protein
MLTMRRLPFLNGVKAFEATARTGSFAKAAEELHDAGSGEPDGAAPRGSPRRAVVRAQGQSARTDDCGPRRC